MPDAQIAVEKDLTIVPPPESGLLAAILSRRSVSKLVDPGPTDNQLDKILTSATSVPDHGTLRPWRVIVISGDQRQRFGKALRAAGVEQFDEPSDAVLEKLESKAFVAPTMVVMVCSPQPSKIEIWEQEASTAAAGYAMSLTAHLLGLGAMWKSAKVRTGTELNALLGMSGEDRLMGWVNLGTTAVPPKERRRPPQLSELAGRLTSSGVVGWTD